MDLLSCPECGKQPQLSTLEPEYKLMKYFCGVHAACGDWKPTEELAAAAWNMRVQEHIEVKQRLETAGTPEWLNKQGNLQASVYCPCCDYVTEVMLYKDLIFKLAMEGGYVISDKSGGYLAQCPKCRSENLILEGD